MHKQYSDVGGAAVTVAILTYKNNHELLRCLNALVQSKFDAPVEILIVDNSKNQDALEIYEMFKKAHLRMSWQYIHLEENSLGLARRRAVELAKSPCLAFIDSDCVVNEHWLSQMLHELTKLNSLDPKIIAVGSGNDQPRDHHTFYDLIRIMKSTYLGHINSTQMALKNQNTRVDHLSTCNVIYVRAALLAAGNFSEAFSRYGEDIEMSRRLIAQGFQLYYTPNCVVKHYDKTHFLDWVRRVFRFGRAQIKLVFRGHRNHLLNRRILMPMALSLLIWVDLTHDYNWPTSGFFTLTYVFTCMAFIFRSCIQARRIDLFFQSLVLLIASHFFYILGQYFEFIFQLVTFKYSTALRQRVQSAIS